MILKVIRQRLVLLTYLCSIGLLFCLIIFIKNFVISFTDMRVIFALLLLVSNLLIILLIREFEVYSAAKLITENKFMCIEVAEIRIKSDAVSSYSKIEGLEVYISCFGILLGSRVIKFNIAGVKLKEVEIGNDFICLTYGNDKKNQTIKLLHGVIEKEELKSIVGGFRYETGIIPIVIN